MIYFDNAATTRVNPEILKTYKELATKYYANPSSPHTFAQETNHLLNQARNQILSSLKIHDSVLIFTSGATESNNLAIKGYALRNKAKGKHIVVSKVEHISVLESARDLEKYHGFSVTYLDVDENGCVDPKILKKALRRDTILVSVMAVNNENGAVNPIRTIGSLLLKYEKIALHVDAAQAIGKVEIDYSNADMITISAHKIEGLKGSGALIKNKKIQLLPLISGGGQEDNLRSGTNDVAMAGALAKAVRLSVENYQEHFDRVFDLMIELRNWILANPNLAELNSSTTNNPYIVNFSLLSKKASIVVEALSRKGIMVSSVSACSSHHEPSSYVIKAMGKDEIRAKNSIRVSFSANNTVQEVKQLIKELERILGEIR